MSCQMASDSLRDTTSSEAAGHNEFKMQRKRIKPVETLVLANIALKAEQKRLNGGDSNSIPKEDERITNAVMKVLEGYDWNLVQASAK